MFSQTIYALSNNNLVAFEASDPTSLLSTAALSGMAAGEEIVGIDFRPANGQLYALGYNAATGQARLYTVDLVSGALMPVGAGPISLQPGTTYIGFDFNPTVDRIRVTGNTGGNYRLHPVTGALVATDGNLAFAGGDPNSGASPNIGASAYTNSYIGTPSTTLYNFDYNLSIFTTQNPPNNGILNTVGNSGLMLNGSDLSVDFDIYFDPLSLTNLAFLAANTGSSINDSLYGIDLTTGSLTPIGLVGMGIEIDDIAVLIDRSGPNMATGDLLYGLTSTGNLVSFDSENPGNILTLVPVTGVTPGQTLVGLDFRPATGQLYAMGYNYAQQEGQLFTINRNTGVATQVDTGFFNLSVGSGPIGFDFNPTVDRIRITSRNNANYRLHPVTADLVATDGNLAFATGDVNAGANPSIGAVAYTNSFGGASTTTLYNYDDSLNVITIQNPPNNGTLNTVGSSGIQLNLANPTADLDIYYDVDSMENRAYFVTNTGSSNFDNLYSVNLTTGTVTSLGLIGLGLEIVDLAAFLTTTITVACPNDTTIKIGVNDTTAVVNYTLPVGTTNCALGGLSTNLLVGIPSGGTFNLGTTAIIYTLSDSCGAVDTCSFFITVELDSLDPAMMVICPNDTLITLPSGDSSAVVNYTLPTATTQCVLNPNIAITLISGPSSGDTLSVGSYSVAYALQDSCGNADTCIFIINIQLDSVQPPTFTANCPSDSVFILPFGSTSGVINYILPTATTVCVLDSTVNVALLTGIPSGGIFNVGNSLVTYALSDSCGNTDTCSFTLTIQADTINPFTIICPADTVISISAGSTSGIVNFNAPTSISSCSLGGVTATQISGPASGSIFTVDTFQIVYAITDSCGNIDTCSFNIVVTTDTLADPCDLKGSGCVQWELISIQKTLTGDRTYTIRVINNCSAEMFYSVFQLPNGSQAGLFPANNSTYVAPSGRGYTVRNPNHSPIYSVRFKGQGVGINNGQSDIFSYTVQEQATLQYIYVYTRLKNGQYYEAHLNTFDCMVMNFSTPNNPDYFNPVNDSKTPFGVYPNPTSGILNIDCSDFGDQPVTIQVFNGMGQLVKRFEAPTTADLIQIDLGTEAATGVYLLALKAADGTQEVKRFVVQRK